MTPRTAQPTRLMLAPMQGLCDYVMRDLLTRIGGYDECVSEFVRITHTVHSRPAWLRHIPEIATANRTFAGTPCSVQLLGSDPENMAENAIQAVRFGADSIDLNFGCPAPTVNKHQGGAVLLKEPQRIYTIVRTVRQRLPENIRLTAKMRLGYDDTGLALENADAIAQGGASLLTVHARTKVQGYQPPAHWHWLNTIRERAAIDIAANGDVFTLQDYIDIRQISGCRHIMLGRGAVIRPDLARQIRQYESGKPVQAALFEEEIGDWVKLFFTLCRQYTDNGRYPAARLKQWLGMMQQAYPQAETLFDRIRPLKENAEIQAALNRFFQ